MRWRTDAKIASAYKYIRATGHADFASESRGPRRKRWLPAAASNGSMNALNRKGKTRKEYQHDQEELGFNIGA